MSERAPVPMQVMTDPRRFYVVCHECQRRSIPLTAGSDGDAWLVLERLGWRCEQREHGVVALCRKCAAKPSPKPLASTRPAKRRRASGSSR